MDRAGGRFLNTIFVSIKFFFGFIRFLVKHYAPRMAPLRPLTLHRKSADGPLAGTVVYLPRRGLIRARQGTDASDNAT